MPPLEFIPVAEELEFDQLLQRRVLDYGMALVDQAMADAEIRSTFADEPLTVWLNVGPRQITHPQFAPTIEKAITDLATNGAKLGLDVTPTPADRRTRGAPRARSAHSAQAPGLPSATSGSATPTSQRSAACRSTRPDSTARSSASSG